MAKILKWLRRNRISIIAFIAFSLIFIVYLIFNIDKSLLIGLLGTTATLYFGLLKFHFEKDRLFKELFQEFNSRYDKKLNDLINELKYDETKRVCPKEKNLIIDYFNLSSEEYLWYKKNRIPSDVWKAWKAGIKDNLKIEQVNEIFKEEIATENGKISYYGLIKELEN